MLKCRTPTRYAEWNSPKGLNLIALLASAGMCPDKWGGTLTDQYATVQHSALGSFALCFLSMCHGALGVAFTLLEGQSKVQAFASAVAQALRDSHVLISTLPAQGE